ncbi:MAG: cation:proton antiporter [Acidobacteriota bacterium]
MGLMIVLAWGVNWGARFLKVPSIVSYLAAGLLVAPALDMVVPWLVPGPTWEFPQAIHWIGEVGIVLLLFIVGLELSLDKIRGVGRVAVVAGLGQVALTAAGGLGITLLLGFSPMESLFLATALTFSSTVVVVKLLDQKRELDTLYGRIAVGIFLVQDLVVVAALILLSGLGSAEDGGWTAAAWSLTGVLLGVVVLLGVAALASRRLLPRPFQWASRSPEMLLIWSLGWCFLFVLAAEHLGLSAELGAFLAGVSLAQLESSRDLARRIHPLMNFFVAVFFISLGAQLPLESAAAFPAAAMVLSLFVLVGNPLIFIWIIARSGYSRRTSFLTGVTVAQISEFSFVFAAKGVSEGLIAEPILSLTAVVGVVTIALSSYLILYNHQLYAWFERRGLLRIFGDGIRDGMEMGEALRGHWVVVGVNALGRRLVELLRERGEKVACIDRDPEKLRQVAAQGIHGGVEFLSVLEAAGLGRARFAVSALRIQDTNNLFAFRCRQLGVPVAIHAFDSTVVPELEALGVEHIINSKRAGVEEVIRLLEGRSPES